MEKNDPRRVEIKKRAQELIAQGLSTGAAAQQAYNEIVAPKTERQQAVEKAVLEAPAAEAKLKETRARYVGERGETIEKTGVSKAQAAAQAEKEFESMFLKPSTTSFESPTPSKLFGVIDIPTSAPEGVQPPTQADLFDALKRRTFLPPSAVPTERQEVAKPSEAAGIIGSGPDWDVVTRDLLNQGLEKKDADAQVFALKRAYDRKVAEKKGKLPKDAMLPVTIAEDSWKETLDEVQGIPAVLADKSKYATDYKPTGPQDPYFLAFSKQVKAGEGVPLVTGPQGEYISALAEYERKAEEEKLRKEYENKPLKKTEVERVEGIRGGSSRSVTRELVGAEKDAEIARMAAEKVTKPWWTDPEEVKKRQADPERYKKPGVFQSETAFGTQTESDVGYITRAAMMPLNAVAGAVFPILFTGADAETRSAVEEARRRARPESYKDNPVLLNIAEGRGFVGEAAELSKLTGLNTDKLFTIPGIDADVTLGTLYTAGAFAADLLDPSLDIVSGFTKGARVAAQAGKAARKVGVEGAAKLAAKEGAAEAVKTVLTENPATNLIAKRMGVAPGDTRLSISDALARQAKRDLFDASGTRVITPESAPEIVKGVSKKLDELDQLVTPNPRAEGKPLSRTELNDALTEAAVRDPDVYDAVKDARGLQDKVEVISVNPQVKQAVQDALIRQTSRNLVFKATGDTVLKSGIVALTRKTFATRDIADKVLKEYKNSDFAKLVSKIQESPKFGARFVSGKPGKFASQMASVEGFNLPQFINGVENPDFQQILNKYAELNRAGAIGIDPQALASGFIDSVTLRKLIDADVDRIAKKYRIATGADIAQTTPIIARELRTPLEVRDFSSPVLRKWISDAGVSKTPVETLTPAQRAIYEPVVDALGKLDVKLRNELNQLIGNKNFRQLYRIPDNVKDRKELLGYLIVGPTITGLPRTYVIEKSLKGATDKVIYTKDTTLDIFDLFSGVRTDEITDVWSEKGRQGLDNLIEQSSSIIDANPAKYAEEMEKVIEGAKRLATDPTNLKVDPKEVLIRKGKNNERLVASYYLAESSRIVNQTIKDVVLEETADISKTFNRLPRADQNTIGSVEKFGDLVFNYIKNVTGSSTFLKQPLEDIIRAVVPTTVTNPGIVIAEVAEVAEKIMKVNGMKNLEDPLGKLREIVNLASKPNPAVIDNLRAFVGQDVADQIVKALESGGAKNIERGLAEAISGKKDTNKLQQLLDNLNSMWYMFTLTISPRFHGGNIIGAPEVVYTSTGKIISPLPIPGTSTYDAMRIIQNAYGPKGGKIAVVDKGGRAYTNNEIYRAVVQSGGESLNKVDIPSVNARYALTQIQGGSGVSGILRGAMKDGIRGIPSRIVSETKSEIQNIVKEPLQTVLGSVGRGVETILQSPQTEDTMYRMAVVLEGIRDGRTLEESIQLGRAALYDKGTIADAEKALSRNIMFYSFTRNNFVNLLKNLTNVGGLKRISNVLKFKRGAESILVPDMTDEEKSYLPEIAATSFILGRGQNVGERGTIITTGSSNLSAIQLLTRFLALDVAGAAESATPRIFGIVEAFKEKDQNEMVKIPPEHLAIIDSFAQITGSKLEDVLSLLAGDKVIPYKSKDLGNYDGMIYPLPSPKARQRYQLALAGLQLVGLDRLSRDIPESLRAPGGKVDTAFKTDNVGYGLQGLYAAGFLAPRRTILAEQQRLRNLLRQNSEGRQMVSDIDEILTNDALAPVSKDVVQQDVEQGRVEKAKELQTISDYEQREIELAREFQNLKSQVLSGKITEAYFEKEATRIENELNELYKQMNAAGR